MGKMDLSYKGSLSRADALDHLNNLINNLRTGRVRLCAGADSVDLDFDAASQVNFFLEAKAKEDRNQLSLKLSWRLPTQNVNESGGLTMEPVPDQAPEDSPKVSAEATEGDAQAPEEPKTPAKTSGQAKIKVAASEPEDPK